MIKADPFAREAFIQYLDIQEQDPLFRQLSGFSSYIAVNELPGLVG